MNPILMQRAALARLALDGCPASGGLERVAAVLEAHAAAAVAAERERCVALADELASIAEMQSMGDVPDEDRDHDQGACDAARSLAQLFRDGAREVPRG